MSDLDEVTPPPPAPKKARKQSNLKCAAAAIKLNVASDCSEIEWSNYFARDEENKIYCNVTDCKSFISRWRPYYFKRHFETKHPSLLKELCPEIVSKAKDCEVAAYEQMFHAVEMVTVNGYPFSILDSSSLQGMLKRQNQDLAANGYKVTIHRRLITEKVTEFADIIRKHITLEVKDKMLSIMFDICTKITLAVIGISITFMSNDEVVTRSLGKIFYFKFIEIKM